MNGDRIDVKLLWVIWRGLTTGLLVNLSEVNGLARRRLEEDQIGRSIIAVAAGVVIGVALVVVAEAIGRQFATAGPMLIVWFSGAFAGAAAASLIARRWAPAAWVVAATILLFAAVGFTGFQYSLWVKLSSVPATALGGFFAVKATKAVYGRPPPSSPKART